MRGLWRAAVLWLAIAFIIVVVLVVAVGIVGPLSTLGE